jgi:hypothetical protein
VELDGDRHRAGVAIEHDRRGGGLGPNEVQAGESTVLGVPQGVHVLEPAGLEHRQEQLRRGCQRGLLEEHRPPGLEEAGHFPVEGAVKAQVRVLRAQCGLGEDPAVLHGGNDAVDEERRVGDEQVTTLVVGDVGEAVRLVHRDAILESVPTHRLPRSRDRRRV